MMKAFCKCMGLAVLAAAMFAACTVEELPVDEPVIEEPVTEPTSIHVTVGVGIAADPATKSEVVMEDGARMLKFTTGDKLYVYREVETGVNLAGELAMVGERTNDDKSATFSGELKVYNDSGTETSYDFGAADPLTGSTAYLLHAGILEGLYTKGADQSLTPVTEKMVAGDVATLMTSALVVTGQYSSTGYSLSTAATPILNCNISGLTASTEYWFVLKKDGGEAQSVSWRADGNGTAALAFASLVLGSGVWTLVVKQGETAVGTIDFGTKDFTSKVYNVRRNYGNAAFGKYIDLSQLTDSDFFDLDTHNYRVKDGDVLTGEYLSDGDIYIEANAKVTLAGVTHHAGDNRYGLICNGSADIILAEGKTNYITAGSSAAFDGILMEENSDEKTYLTISGPGTLLVSGGAGCCGIGGRSGNQNIIINGGIIEATGGAGAAGIGGSSESGFGEITINGGTVKATGGTGAAGIGSGTLDNSICGNITINGGTVDATGGAGAAGIGCGDARAMKCGAITISNQVTSVTARRGGESVQPGSSPRYPSCIGKSADSRTFPGDITFGSMLVYSSENRKWYNSSTSEYTTEPTLSDGTTYGGLKLEISNPDGDEHDEVWTLTPVPLTQ